MRALLSIAGIGASLGLAYLVAAPVADGITAAFTDSAALIAGMR